MKTVSGNWSVTARAVAMGAAILFGSAGLAQAQPMTGMQGPGAGAAMHDGPGMHGQHMGPLGRMIGPMLQAAGATPEQRAQVHEITKAAREELRGQHEARKADRQQMAQLLTAPQLDPAAVEAVRVRISAQHDLASRRMTQAMLQASAVLTPEQRQKVASFMSSRREMMQRHWRERQSLRPGQGT